MNKRNFIRLGFFAKSMIWSLILFAVAMLLINFDDHLSNHQNPSVTVAPSGDSICHHDNVKVVKAVNI